MKDGLNDNDTARAHSAEPDAHGQAAMLLVESLIHGLIAREVITTGEAIEIVEVASDVKKEIASDVGDSPATLRHSLNLLEAISQSLAIDGEGKAR